MFRRDLTAEQLEEIDEPFVIVSQGAMAHVAKNAPDDVCALLVFRLQGLVNFTTFSEVPLKAIGKGTGYSRKRILAGLQWLEEAELLDRAERDDGVTLWRFTELFGFEGTPETWRALKQLQDAH